MVVTRPVCPTCHLELPVSGVCGEEHSHPRPPAPTPPAVRTLTATRPTRALVKRRDRFPGRFQVPGCWCGRPTTDGAYLCSDCLNLLGTCLLSVPDVTRRLNNQRVTERGVDYRTLGGGTGGTKEVPLPIRPAAMLARDRLRKVLRSLVLACLQAQLGDPTDGRRTIPPRGDVPAMAAWLLVRVDLMAWHPDFVSAPSELARAVGRADVAATPAPHRQHLGACILGCGGALWALEGEHFAECDYCTATIEAQLVRDGLIRDLGEKWCTAAEIARLSTYLALTSDRDLVRRRLNMWHHRGLLPCFRQVDVDLHGEPMWPPAAVPPPLFRFGDAYALLLLAEQTIHVRPTRTTDTKGA